MHCSITTVLQFLNRASLEHDKLYK